MSSNLSPAAQAVQSAYLQLHAVHPQWSSIVLATILEVASDQLQFRDQLGLMAYGGYALAQEQLRSIANELSDYRD